jgi:hypothetical protein
MGHIRRPADFHRAGSTDRSPENNNVNPRLLPVKQKFMTRVDNYVQQGSYHQSHFLLSAVEIS